MFLLYYSRERIRTFHLRFGVDFLSLNFQTPAILWTCICDVNNYMLTHQSEIEKQVCWDWRAQSISNSTHHSQNTFVFYLMMNIKHVTVCCSAQSCSAFFFFFTLFWPSQDLNEKKLVFSLINHRQTLFYLLRRLGIWKEGEFKGIVSPNWKFSQCLFTVLMNSLRQENISGASQENCVAGQLSKVKTTTNNLKMTNLVFI